MGNACPWCSPTEGESGKSNSKYKQVTGVLLTVRRKANIMLAGLQAQAQRFRRGEGDWGNVSGAGCSGNAQ